MSNTRVPSVKVDKDLHNLMIDFITTNSRLLKMEWHSTWVEFYGEHLFSRRAFNTEIESVDCAKNTFLKIVLPNIYTYDLTEDQKNYLELLNNDANYSRTDNGFKVNTIPKYYLDTFNLKKEDISLYTEMENISANEQILFVNLKLALKLKKMVERSRAYQHMLSFFYLTEEETKNGILLSMDEIIKRAIEHKKHKILPHNIKNLDQTLETTFEEEDFLKSLFDWVEMFNSI